ncbi:hypothetical protein LLS1_35390 [Leifsonia sp. LS1]|nr:hypothetical protein LLS1_35390 [Leifsonia sp. LS1]
MKRKVEEAQAAAKSAQDGVETLRGIVLVQQSLINASSQSTANNSMTVHIGDDKVTSTTSEHLQKLAHRVETQNWDWAADPRGVPSNAELKVAILEHYEVLTEMIGWTRVPRRSYVRADDSMKWFELDHAAEISAVRTVRNAVAHARPVSEEDLEAALVVLRELLTAAQRHRSES